MKKHQETTKNLFSEYNNTWKTLEYGNTGNIIENMLIINTEFYNKVINSTETLKDDGYVFQNNIILLCARNNIPWPGQHYINDQGAKEFDTSLYSRFIYNTKTHKTTLFFIKKMK